MGSVLRQRTQSAWLGVAVAVCTWAGTSAAELEWTELPPLPNPEGVAGPFVGTSGDAVIVAGGANFPNEPRWETDKVWHRDTYVLTGDDWTRTGALRRAMAYGASVTLPEGVLCMGGNDAGNTFADVFLLTWDPGRRALRQRILPALPAARAYGAAAIAADTVFFVGGQGGAALSTAANDVWALDVSGGAAASTGWRSVAPIPGPGRAFHAMAAIGDGQDAAVYVLSGRSQAGDEVEFLDDLWRYRPSTDRWESCAPASRPFMAGTMLGWDSRYLMVLGGDDGALFHRADELQDEHPGFPREAFMYDILDATWASLGASPSNQVSTTATLWGGGALIASGEVRPRVRSPQVWLVTPGFP